jgi:fructokinase
MKMAPYEVVCFGELLWDVLPSGAKPGGAPMNVAYHLQKLGMDTALISKVGKDERGEKLVEELKKNGIATEFVQVDKEHVTGIVNATVQPGNEVSYDIVQPVAWDFIEWKNNLSLIVEAAEFFVYGSLAARNKQSKQTVLQLIEAAKVKVVDINLRPPHFTPGFIENLLSDADIVKVNEHELLLITQWYTQLSEINDRVKFVQDKFSIPVVIVTRGENGSLVCKEGAIFTHKGYQVQVADTIGSGDAFLAAFLYKTGQGADVDSSLKFANALGALIASKEGACPKYNLEEVHELMNQSFVF